MKTRFLLAALLISLSVASCIRDDRSDCKGKVHLDFIYYGDGSEDIFQSKITKVNMFLYSADDFSLVQTMTIDQSSLAKSQGVDLDLDPGSYRAVFWGNAYSSTEINSTWGEASVGEIPQSKAATYVGTDSLYFNSTDFIVPSSLVDVYETCYFESSHIDMKVKVTGFVGALTTSGEVVDDLRVAQTNVPAHTDFYNVPSDTDRCDVTPALSADPDDAESYILKYNVLRFTEDEDVAVVLYNGDDVLYTVSMPDFLSKFDVQLTGVQEAEVSMQITLGTVGIEVVEWTSSEVSPGFDK